MKNLIVLLFICIANFTSAQELLQLIGLDVASSSSSQSSNEDSETLQSYTPLKTLGVYRNGNTVEVYTLDHLLIPTISGFKHATLNVVETDFIKDPEREMYIPEGTYKLEESYTKPIFFDSKSAIDEFIKSLSPILEDAIKVDFETFSFVNSKFYTTTGFESFVHGGASWFNADQKLNIYPIDWKKGALSNRITDHLSNAEKNKILIAAAKSMGEYIPNDVSPDKDLMLPWSTTVDEFQDVFFDFQFLNKGIGIIPFSQLQGNSSRSFLQDGPMLEDLKLYETFAVQKPVNADAVIILSPDKSTRTEFNENTISVYDHKTNQLLKTIELNFNKLIMSEFAIGKYAKRWVQEFE